MFHGINILYTFDVRTHGTKPNIYNNLRAYFKLAVKVCFRFVLLFKKKRELCHFYNCVLFNSKVILVKEDQRYYFNQS